MSQKWVLAWVLPRTPRQPVRPYAVSRTPVRASVIRAGADLTQREGAVDRSFVELLASHSRRMHDWILVLIDDLGEQQLPWQALPTSRSIAWNIGPHLGTDLEVPMDAVAFFRLRYESLHSTNEVNLLEGLTNDQIRCKPLPGVNSIVWLLWHMTRCEDVGVNRLVVDRRQVLAGNGWADRLGVSLRDIATGMADEEVRDFSERVDVPALLAYRAAVGQRTYEVLDELDPAILAHRLDPVQLRCVVAEGALGPNAGWVEEHWRSRTRGWCLAQLGLTHNYSHFGEGYLVRGLLGYPRR